MQYIIRQSSRSKRISLRVAPPDQVIVSAPKLVPKRIIDSFVSQHLDWINKKLALLKKQQLNLNSQDEIMIFGNKYEKQMIDNSSAPQGISINKDQIICNFPKISLSNSTTINKEFTIFLKKAARKYLITRAKDLASQMAVNYKSLLLRQQKTRWGSCSSRDQISLNWRLVHYPTSVIDYVVIHELAHLVHHDHSRQFWRLVAKYDPEYKEHQRYLRKYGFSHELE